MTLPFRLPHVVLHEEIRQDTSLKLNVAEQIEKCELPRVYSEHKVVIENPDECVLPISLYMDGVAYSECDSVVGVWVHNEASGRRHLLGLVRKLRQCDCGCRGRDTWQPILECLRWSLEVLANGIGPRTRHDGSPLRDSDLCLQPLVDRPLGFLAATMYLKGDWAEICERYAFPAHSSGLRPCFCCAAPPVALKSALGYSLDGGPHRFNTTEDYVEATERCELTRRLTAEQYYKVKDATFWDSRQNGFRGLALKCDIPELELLRGDRIEPCLSRLDVGTFESIATFPCEVHFWRTTEETITHHRCPLFSEAIGVSPHSIAIDALHTWYLGPLLIWVREAFWVVLQSRPWGPFSASAELANHNTITCLDNELRSFYKEWDAGHDIKCSRVSRLTMKMLGKSGKKKLKKVKAIQAWFLCLFFVHHFSIIWKPIAWTHSC